MAKRSKSKEDELLRRLFSGSEALSKPNQEFAAKALRMAWAHGMPKKKTVGSGDNEVETDTDIYDALKFIRSQYEILKSGTKLNAEVDKIRRELEAIVIPEKIKKVSSANPYSAKGRKNTSMPWSFRQRIEKKYADKLSKFRTNLNSPDLPIGLHQEPLVGPTLEGSTGYEQHATIARENEKKAAIKRTLKEKDMSRSAKRSYDFRRAMAELGHTAFWGGRELPNLSEKKWKALDYAVGRGWGSGSAALDTAQHILDLQAKARGAKTLAQHKGKRNFTWWYDHLDEDQKLEFDETMHYGGGSEGRRMAKEKIQEDRDKRAEELHKERRSRDRHTQNIAQKNFNYDMMDEFDQKMWDLTERYGGDRGKADEAYRNMLEKELPPFFKNSRYSTKNLHEIADVFSSVKRLPLLGQAIEHPVLTSMVALARSIGGSIKEQIDSAQSVVHREAKQEYYGEATRREKEALLGAGVSIDEYNKVVGSKKAKLAALKYGVGIEKLNDIAIFAQGHARTGELIEAMMSGDYSRSMSIAYDIGSSLDVKDRPNFLNAVEMSDAEYKAERIKRRGRLTREESLTRAYSEVKEIADKQKADSAYMATMYGIADTGIKIITLGGTDLQSVLSMLFASDDLYDSNAKNQSSVSSSVDSHNTQYNVGEVHLHGVQDVEGMERRLREKANSSNTAVASKTDPKGF